MVFVNNLKESGRPMVREFLRNWSPVVESAPGLRQAGALPYSVVDGRMTFLLITSRRTGRWIFPKGAIEPGMTAAESAAIEAMEEAGVSGQIEDTPIGSYRTGSGANGSALVDVDIYPMRVMSQLDIWKEMGQRLRHWAVLPEARRLLADPDLGRLVVALHNRGVVD
ncbi:NUDIX hydrolase [Devosia sp. FKR38]|uniref:NUDIX hydrolase n=1 Tax=Devosia sp. FKR38 TaxID=2562312 RepID=UPI0010BF6D47|nr:NUDIX hydrolase [Devosia sp. FKR38]